jgi:hypothetical protein
VRSSVTRNDRSKFANIRFTRSFLCDEIEDFVQRALISFLSTHKVFDFGPGRAGRRFLRRGSVPTAR